MEIEGAVYGSLGMTGNSIGASGQGFNPDTQEKISRDRKAQEDIIDLTNRNGVWVEDMSVQSSLAANSTRKVNGVGNVTESVAYDSKGNAITMPLNLKGRFVDVYA